MKIILFGGSFDPPHLGHKKIIEECLKYKFDKFILMPSYKSPLKTTSTLSSKNHRLEMLNLLINDLEFPIDINTWEINQNRQSFTYLSINYLKKKYLNSSISLVIGSDQLRQFSSWKNYKYILENVHIICFRRYFNELNPLEGMSMTWNNDFNVDISSSMIREKIKKGESFKNEMPPSILKYIKNNNLYGILNDN